MYATFDVRNPMFPDFSISQNVTEEIIWKSRDFLSVEFQNKRDVFRMALSLFGKHLFLLCLYCNNISLLLLKDRKNNKNEPLVLL